MTKPPSVEIALLLQKGIAAARSGRSVEARQLLQEVLEADSNNEMAWLWLSSLMRTDQQKQACLEQVMRINPENVYARAGLTRLQRVSQAEADLETRLASATSGHVPDSSTEAKSRQIEPITSSPSNGTKAVQPREAQRVTNSTAPPSPGTAPVSSSFEMTCPACDGPIAPTVEMCPHCYMTLKSFDELLRRGTRASSSTPSQPKGRRRKGLFGF